MESVFAFVTRDSVVVCSDMTQSQDIFVLNQNADRIHEMFNKHLMTITGDPGDSCSHTDYIKRNLSLEYYRNNMKVPTINSCVSWIRQGVWEAIRDHPLKIKIVYAGLDSNNAPSLYMIDEYGCLIKPDYIAVNYSMYFLLATLDRYWKLDMTDEEVVDLVKKCITVLGRRMLLQQHKFLVKVATRDGIKK